MSRVGLRGPAGSFLGLGRYRPRARLTAAVPLLVSLLLTSVSLAPGASAGEHARHCADAYITNEPSFTVSVRSSCTNAVIDAIRASASPIGVAVTPANLRVSVSTVSVDLKGHAAGTGTEFLWSLPRISNHSVLTLRGESQVGGETRAVYVAAHTGSATISSYEACRVTAPGHECPQFILPLHVGFKVTR